jgi:hypothetical protein
MKHLKKFESTFQSAEGSGQVPEVPTGRKLRPYMIDNLKPEMGDSEVMKPTKSEVLGKIKDILNKSGKLGDLFVSMVQSKKGNYLQILDGKDRSIGIYITDIDPTMSNSQEPYEGI